MQRGEKRSMLSDNTPDDNVPSPTAPAAKKAKLPDFDWSANNYELTWKLVNELVKPENKPVLFPEIEGMRSVTGETKEDVYRRIAKVVHPEAYSQDPHTAGSRMKNKNMSMWKEYSAYCRKLQDLCSSHHITLPSTGPDQTFPAIIQEEWRRIMISMPAFAKLFTFMPVRAEDKPKIPTQMKPPSLRSTPLFSAQQSMDEDHLMGEQHIVSSSSSPAFSKYTFTNGAALHDTPVVMNGSPKPQVNGIHKPLGVPLEKNHHHTPIMTSQKANSPSFQNLLDLHKLYQEDCRLGIFSVQESKQRIENLEKEWGKMVSSQQYSSSPGMSPAGLPNGNTHHNHVNGITPSSPTPESEQQYDEKAAMLGYRRPSPPHPLASFAPRDLFKAILEHAAECRLPECRLDNLNRTPRLVFIPSQEKGHVQIAIVTPSGPEPLVNHVSAACRRFISRNTISVMDVTLVIHQSAGWETTMWDHANAVVGAALSRRLNQEEIKSIQANAQQSYESSFRKTLGYLNENSSTLFDVLRSGQLYGNTWESQLVSSEDGVSVV